MSFEIESLKAASEASTRSMGVVASRTCVRARAGRVSKRKGVERGDGAVEVWRWVAHEWANLDGDAECRQRVDERGGPEGEVVCIVGIGHRSEISQNVCDLICLLLALVLANEINPFAHERL